jgi:hypothetical protein
LEPNKKERAASPLLIKTNHEFGLNIRGFSRVSSARSRLEPQH